MLRAFPVIVSILLALFMKPSSAMAVGEPSNQCVSVIGEIPKPMIDEFSKMIEETESAKATLSELDFKSRLDLVQLGRCGWNIFNYLQNLKNDGQPVEGKVLILRPSIWGSFIAGGKMPPDNKAWLYHVVLVVNGRILDFDFQGRMNFLPQSQYFEEMFGYLQSNIVISDRNKEWSTRYGLNNLQIMEVPIEEFLMNFESESQIPIDYFIGKYNEISYPIYFDRSTYKNVIEDIQWELLKGRHQFIWFVNDAGKVDEFFWYKFGSFQKFDRNSAPEEVAKVYKILQQTTFRAAPHEQRLRYHLY